MTLIQRPGPTRKLQQALGLTHQPDGILGPEIVGVILLEDLSEPLSDVERGCMGGGSQAAVALENSFIALTRQLANPRGTIRITGAFISTSVDMRVMIRTPTVDLTGMTDIPASFTDRKIAGAPSTLFQRDTTVGLPTGGQLWRGLVLANTPVQISLAVKLGNLADGTGRSSILIGCETVNAELSGGFYWTEADPPG